MEDPKLVRTSKYLSFILRHAPETIGLKLDNDGWAEVEELIQCAAEAGMRLDARIIGEVVCTSDKKRFTLSHDGLRIRAAQGHSAASANIRYAEAAPRTCFITVPQPAISNRSGYMASYLAQGITCICRATRLQHRELGPDTESPSFLRFIPAQCTGPGSRSFRRRMGFG